jgi:ABC-2 type transport system permease protein
VPEAGAAGALGFGFGLLTASLGAGIAVGIVFTLVFDGFVSFIPGAEDYTYGQLSQDPSNNITGVGETQNGLAVALVGTVLWCVVLIIPGWIRFTRSDLE